MARPALLLCFASPSSLYLFAPMLHLALVVQKAPILRMDPRKEALRASQCPGACRYRCSKTTKKACMFCQKCCAKCLCVPPGTYGNKQVFPCDNDWKTQQGGSSVLEFSLTHSLYCDILTGRALQQGRGKVK
ncbi:hypothetical protein L7F22_051555 [Adiantum nelumboides]|nr:hypothetical protein [Adiantum nelumboides]